MFKPPYIPPQIQLLTDEEWREKRKKERQAARQAQVELLREYANEHFGMRRTDASVVGRVGYRSYLLGVSEADTVRVLGEYFESTGSLNRRWWIEQNVQGARHLAEENGEVWRSL